MGKVWAIIKLSLILWGVFSLIVLGAIETRYLLGDYSWKPLYKVGQCLSIIGQRDEILIKVDLVNISKEVYLVEVFDPNNEEAPAIISLKRDELDNQPSDADIEKTACPASKETDYI